MRCTLRLGRGRAASMSRHTGAFVYTGSGKKQRDDAPVEQKACKKEACAIQWCLARRNHQERYCQAFIQAWEDCCATAKKQEAQRIAAEREAAAAAAPPPR